MAWKFMLSVIGLCSATALAAQDSSATAGVCGQLAPQAGLKPQADGLWRVNMLGLGASLFGGSTGASFQVLPIEGSTADQQFGKVCVQKGAEIMCHVVGPARIVIGTKKGNATADVKAGDTVDVGMKGRYITCRDAR